MKSNLSGILSPPREIVGGGTSPFDPLQFKSRRSLEDRMSEAISWGCPDRESTGMSYSQLTSLLSEALEEIRRLKK